MFNPTRRLFMQTALGATIAASCGVVRAATVPDWVDPELRSALAPMLAPSPFANLPPTQMIYALRHVSYGTPSPLASVPYERRLIASGSAAPMIPLYIVNAKAGARRPAILHTHGGGFIVGSPQPALVDLQKTAQALNCVRWRIAGVSFRKMGANCRGLIDLSIRVGWSLDSCVHAHRIGTFQQLLVASPRLAASSNRPLLGIAVPGPPGPVDGSPNIPNPLPRFRFRLCFRSHLRSCARSITSITCRRASNRR